MNCNKKLNPDEKQPPAEFITSDKPFKVGGTVYIINRDDIKFVKGGEIRVKRKYRNGNRVFKVTIDAPV